MNNLFTLHVCSFVICSVDGLHLFQYICQYDAYSEAVIILFMKQLSNALLWLHKRNIAHLDIKPENIMINSGAATPLGESRNTVPIKGKGLLKLIDFGSSVNLVSRINNSVQSANIEFSSPEMILGQSLCHYTDSWCFGVLLYVFLSGVSPFLDDSFEETTTNILKCDFSFPEEYFQNVSMDAKNMLTRLLVLQPNGRITMSDCQMSSWFTNVCRYKIYLQIIINLIEFSYFF